MDLHCAQVLTMLVGENIEAVEGVVSQLHPPSQDRMVQDFRRFSIFCGVVGSLLSVVYAPVLMLRVGERHTALQFLEFHCCWPHAAFHCTAYLYNFTSQFLCSNDNLY